MRSSFTPEEVDRIENKAYEVGVGVGEFQERKRILEAIGTCPCNCPQDHCECGCGEEPEFTRNELLYIINGETNE